MQHMELERFRTTRKLCNHAQALNELQASIKEVLLNGQKPEVTRVIRCIGDLSIIVGQYSQLLGVLV